MKFLSFEKGGAPGWGAHLDGTVVDLGGLAPGLRDAIARGLLPADAAAARRSGPELGPDALRFLPAIPDPVRILCIGLNYVAHREETGRRPTQHPTIFIRYPSSLVGHGEPLLLPPESASYDYEGELAVVIGRSGRRIPRAQALDYVAGYSCFMDGSIRDFQLHTNQYAPGKNFDRSGAFGPWMVSADEFGPPNGERRLCTRLNGTEMQAANTDQMIFPVDELIAYISSFMTLDPGDVIATGTPGGVGFKREPPVFMRDGDRIEVEIEGIGVLSNPVVAEKR